MPLLVTPRRLSSASLHRHRGINIDLHSKVDVLQVHNRLLATVLLKRCDYTILLTFLNDRKSETRASSSRIQVDLSINRKECENLMAESESRTQPGNYVEGLLYWARFLALERSLAEPGLELTQLLDKAREYLQLAHEICDEYPGRTAGIGNEVGEVEKMLRDSTFYMQRSHSPRLPNFEPLERKVSPKVWQEGKEESSKKQVESTFSVLAGEEGR